VPVASDRLDLSFSPHPFSQPPSIKYRIGYSENITNQSYNSSTLAIIVACHCKSSSREEVELTMLVDADEEGLVSIEIPPISGYVGLEGLWDPDIQLTINERQTNTGKSD